VRLHEEQKMTLVLVTHDMIIARKAGRNLRMLDGRIVFDGAPTP
jgi:putative ABC transport system ATP-binding protein